MSSSLQTEYVSSVSVHRILAKAAGLESEACRLREALEAARAELEEARDHQRRAERELGQLRSSTRQRTQAMQDEAEALHAKVCDVTFLDWLTLRIRNHTTDTTNDPNA